MHRKPHLTAMRVSQVRTVDSSVLDSEDIGLMINPREMSDEEAAEPAAQGVLASWADG